MSRMRLDRYLAEMGCGTRTQVKKEISRGNVNINGKAALRPEEKVDPDTDRVTFQGTEISYIRYEYYMLNKPAGVVSATEDSRDGTVVGLIGERQRKDLFPVGRLDKDTEGLLLITNDGDLAHRLLSPKKHVDKVYFARVAGEVTEEDKEAFARGVDIGDEKLTLPAELEILRVEKEAAAEKGAASEGMFFSEIRLTIREGRFHQVKRMFQAVGKEVVYLKRIRMGSLVLDEDLKTGEYRKLTEEEIRALC
ncbi:16S rRNA pseudouridine(516) synthase [Lachnoclostridium sp. An169]|uniref:pseudouridine synthase n=1 Tax=Lachnoclostridium sp. An169 TaxID=1965569 RepID=UPI000B3734AA|nr:pseudouridine synthase [Lachnoclostridium sp. An169]OUP83042.1 16S rRNA pseudouridine(516) synthase [Lachnoclostridium sp. An169]